MLLGIVLHATLPYFARIAGIESMWPADDDQSLALLVLFDFIHLWRMPVFFLLAGFFAHLVLERRSTGAFIRDRLQRIAVPLVLFTGVMALILPVLWNYGWKGEFAVDPGVLDPRKWPHYAAQGMPLATSGSCGICCSCMQYCSCCAVSVRPSLAWLSATCHPLRRWGGARSPPCTRERPCC